jgi:nucleoside 2-deoxyribosyltransferase
LIFFGYAAGRKSSVETIRAIAYRLERECGQEIQLWESMLVDGRVIIDLVLEQIDAAEMCIFDLTQQSENVLFEIGYAIAKAKPLWLTFDTTVGGAKSGWKELALLNPVGYTYYMNSDDLVNYFKKSDPLNNLTPVYDDLIEPVLSGVRQDRSILYCSTFEPFEASNRLSTFLDSRRQHGLKVIISDPKESTLDSITWYAPRIIQSSGVLVHFAGRHRNRRFPRIYAGTSVAAAPCYLATTRVLAARPVSYATHLARFTD